jgi:osmotically-inducible protein OsmY
MILRTIKGTVLSLIFSAGLLAIACKNKEKNRDVNTTTNVDTMTRADTPTAVTPAPATITEAQVKDATKDFPGVQATVNNGEVTLTGTISREKLPRLMQSVQALNPVKVNNNLTIK